jgi:hypothetical protein
MALGDYVVEEADKRQFRRQSLDWGEVIWYTRVVTIPEGKVDTELNSALRLGTIIPARLHTAAPATTHGVEPTLTKVDRGQAAARTRIVLTYLEAVPTGAYSDGYQETNRSDDRHNFRCHVETWGVSDTKDSEGIPKRKDVLDNKKGVFEPRWFDGQVDEKYPGKWIVHTVWSRFREFQE